MKYNIGQRIPREGKTDLIVFECLPDCGYAAHTMRPAIRDVDIATVAGNILEEGRVAHLANGKEIVLVADRGTRYWDNAWNDRIELTETEIDEALAGQHARMVYSSVATKCEKGGNSRNIRFLPRRTAARDD